MKKTPDKNGALQHRAGNGAQRIARLAAQRGGASNPTKLNMARTSAGPSAEKVTPFQPELIHVGMESEVKRQHGQHHDNEADRAISIQSINSAESFTSR